MTKQIFSLQNIMTYIHKRWSTALDVRKPGKNVQYKVADGILAALRYFSCNPAHSWNINDCCQAKPTPDRPKLSVRSFVWYRYTSQYWSNTIRFFYKGIIVFKIRLYKQCR